MQKSKIIEPFAKDDEAEIRYLLEDFKANYTAICELKTEVANKSESVVIPILTDALAKYAGEAALIWDKLQALGYTGTKQDALCFKGGENDE